MGLTWLIQLPKLREVPPAMATTSVKPAGVVVWPSRVKPHATTVETDFAFEAEPKVTANAKAAQHHAGRRCHGLGTASGSVLVVKSRSVKVSERTGHLTKTGSVSKRWEWKIWRAFMVRVFHGEAHEPRQKKGRVPNAPPSEAPRSARARNTPSRARWGACSVGPCT